jgi:hypothetical protein
MMDIAVGEIEGRRTTDTTPAEVGRGRKSRELLGCDFGFADCAFEAGIGIFEDVEAVV